MGKNRLFYIDALRAFAIISVVLGHLPIYVYGGNTYEVLTKIVNPFHMPLFMMISGYVTNLTNFSLQGRLKLLIPFLILGLSYTYMTGGDVITFFTSESKNGYWFLWAIVIFFILLSLIRKCKVNFLVSIAIVELGFFFLHFLFRRTVIGTTISTDYLWQMWPAFSLGVALREVFWARIKEKPICKFIAILLIGLLILGGAYQINNDIVHKLLYVSAGIPLALSLMILFAHLEKMLNHKDFYCKKVVKYIVSEIGGQTLQVYTLHYFVLYFINLHTCVTDMDAKGLRLLVLLVSPLLAWIITCFCVVVGKLIYRLHLGFVFGR